MTAQLSDELLNLNPVFHENNTIHIDELLNLNSVFHENNTGRLRTLYDLVVETHYRGLLALGIDENTYSCIVIPKLLEKMPEGVRLSMTRVSEDYQEWNIKQMLRHY